MKKKSKKAVMYALFVWDEEEFSHMAIYKKEKDALAEYESLKDEISECDFQEWGEIGGKEFLCTECDLIVRLFAFEIEDMSIFDENLNLKPEAKLYVYADAEMDKYNQIGHVSICGLEEAKEHIRDWYGDQQNYFDEVPEEQGLVKPVEEVEQLIAGDIEEYGDYIYSDYGRYGGYYAGIGVKKVTAII